MTKILDSRDFLQISDAARLVGVSEQTLRNWDRAGKLRAHRHPINGYRLYRAADLHALLEQISSGELFGGEPIQGSLNLENALALPIDSPAYLRQLPPPHWSSSVALDPKHRPQQWHAPSSTVRRDWRKYPQEAHVIDRTGRAYRRLTVDEIAILQGFDPAVVNVPGLTDREKIAALGDAVPPPLAKAVMAAVDADWTWTKPTALEICAGVGGLAEGATHIGLEHEGLIEVAAVCEPLLKRNRPWADAAVRIADVRAVDYSSYRSRVGLLSGGPPCQPWSQSGRRRGQEDDRDLLGHLDELVRQLEPEVFVFENVPGLATPANADYLRHVIDTLREPALGLSYGVMAAIVNAADFGVPQVRRRIFIIGLRDKPAAAAGKCFERLERMATHADPMQPRGNRERWVTVGQAIGDRPDPGGWHQWISSR